MGAEVAVQIREDGAASGTLEDKAEDLSWWISVGTVGV